MTIEDFRRLALSLPETCEKAHMGHPDFRVGGKIFATIPWPERNWGMVKLLPEQHKALIKDKDAFEAVPGGWGRQGATYVNLDNVDQATLREALLSAWRRTAPKRVAAKSADRPP